MPNLRDTIFISHATPEDNDFTIWLASRLQFLGYNVWIDKNALMGGEKFWEEIDQIIRIKAAKFLLVYSKNICSEGIAGKLKDGISKEYSLAEGIGKQNQIAEFIISLKIDDSPYNLFIGSDRLNQISFHDNWADGLNQLLKKLKKDNIPVVDDKSNDEFLNWFQYQYLIPNPVIKKKELYYSNIWPITQLPEYFYIHQFRKEEQADFFYNNHKKYPVGKIANHIIAFEADLLFDSSDQENGIVPVKTYAVTIKDMLSGIDNAIFPTLNDTINHFKVLVKRVFHMIMKNRGMFWYEMANKRLAYFYTPANLTSSKVKFKYPFRRDGKKTKSLFGIYKTIYKWHYAVSVKIVLSPVLGFALKNHLTFTNNGFQVWVNANGESDKDKIHSHRRSKGKTFYNEEWRDMLLAFLHGLKKEDRISILISNDFELNLTPNPEMYWSTFGYFDPKDKSRQAILSYYEDDEEELENNEDIHSDDFLNLN